MTGSKGTQRYSGRGRPKAWPNTAGHARAKNQDTSVKAKERSLTQSEKASSDDQGDDDADATTVEHSVNADSSLVTSSGGYAGPNYIDSLEYRWCRRSSQEPLEDGTPEGLEYIARPDAVDASQIKQSLREIASFVPGVTLRGNPILRIFCDEKLLPYVVSLSYALDTGFDDGLARRFFRTPGSNKPEIALRVMRQIRDDLERPEEKSMRLKASNAKQTRDAKMAESLRKSREASEGNAHVELSKIEEGRERDGTTAQAKKSKKNKEAKKQTPDPAAEVRMKKKSVPKSEHKPASESPTKGSRGSTIPAAVKKEERKRPHARVSSETDEEFRKRPKK